MIRWCTYCQSYMGESEPFNKFDLTHGMCAGCAKSGAGETAAAVKQLRPLSDFFRKLRAEVRKGINSDPADWIKKAFELGIKPQDLLLGVVQPVLYEVGELWAKGEITVAAEHRFSAFTEAMVNAIFLHYPDIARHRQSEEPDILLANADGNYHTLGLKFLELGLLAAGLKTFTVLPGLPCREVLGLVNELHPGGVGLSISLPAQAGAAVELAAALRELPEKSRPILLLGGLPVKTGAALPQELAPYACKSILNIPLEHIRYKSRQGIC